MRSLISMVFSFTLTSGFVADLAHADSPEFTHYRAALHLIQARNAGKVCENNASQETIIEMAARAVADDPSSMQNFSKDIPKNSDILENLLFKSLLANIDIQAISDEKILESLLTNTKYFSANDNQATLELKAHQLAVLKINNKTFNGKWRSSIEIQPGGDYYLLIKVEVKGLKFLYLISIDKDRVYSLSREVSPQSDLAQTLFLFPTECRH